MISLLEPFMVKTLATFDANEASDFFINDGKVILTGNNIKYINDTSVDYTYTSFGLKHNHNIGIGISKPKVKFQVSGAVRFSNLERGMTSGSGLSGISCTHDGDLVYDSSDVNLKNNIITINNGLNIVNNLKHDNIDGNQMVI